ncbi:MAG TPA: dihydroorotate dehydrogenase catalytic subunit, partial [Gaiellales bacterium]|nr:dihydroorotate dehydrogenase catalytic subunit [Gaiellales bacterium]
MTFEVVSAVRRATRLPVIPKLSPNVADITVFARASEEAGATALSCINTLLGLAYDPATRAPALGAGGGGLSGPAVKPAGLHAVFHCFARTGLPIVGMGGVASVQDVVEYLAAGASAVGLGTALFRDPGLPAQILPELDAELARRGRASVAELVGCAHQASAKALQEI